MNPRDLSLILAQGIVFYLFFSTLVTDAAIVGLFGQDVAMLSHNVFGAISYVMYGVILYILYKIYRTENFSFRNAEVVVASFLLFFTLLIVQALLLPLGFDGSFGRNFNTFLTPYIGIFGVWIFWIVMTLISIVMLKELSIDELIALLSLKKREPKPVKEVETKKEETSVPEPFIALEENIEEKTVQEVASQTLEDKLKNILPEDDNENYEIKLHSAQAQEVIEKTPTKEKEEEIDEEMVSNLLNEALESSKEEELFEPIEEAQTSESKDTSSLVIVSELEENKKLLEENIVKGKKIEKPKDFLLPPLSMLRLPDKKQKLEEDHLDHKIANLIDKLKKFKIEGDVIRTYTGPVVSTFEFKPAAHIKVSKILSLQDDLAMALKAKTIRIQAPIPGKDVVGIEIPNEEVHTIYLREILETDLFQSASSPLTIVLGQDIVGNPFVTDLKKLPHLLIAGTTGSGKSVGINAMILSLLYRNSPDQLKIIMIDPKMLEFSIYNDIPHLLTPVITKAKQAISALNNMVSEMERRYTLMSESKTKNIDGYNEKMERQGKDKLPFIVVIIDELADLMMTSGKEVEYSIGRLAQMARASGIHLIVATQRPSVDVVTGLIKANLPSRISYKVGQKIDSKVILDSMGAESLLGRGDMLFTPPGASGLVRLHAPWSDEQEIEDIVEFIKSQKEVVYDQRFLAASNGDDSDDIVSDADLDPLYDEAKSIVLSEGKTSISYLQRRLQIGYNKAARIVEQLEAMGVLSEPNAKGAREIL